MSSALRRWLGDPSPRMVDVAITVAVGVPVVGTTLASGIEQDRVLAGLGVRARRNAAAAGPPALAVRGAGNLAGGRDRHDGGRPVRVSDHGGAVHDRLDAVGGDARRRGAPPAAGLIYMLAGGTEFTYDDLIAVGPRARSAPDRPVRPQPARTRRGVPRARRAARARARAAGPARGRGGARADRPGAARRRRAQREHDRRPGPGARHRPEARHGRHRGHREARPRGDGGDAPHAQAAASRRGPSGRARRSRAGRPRRPIGAPARGRPARRAPSRATRGRSPRASTCRRSGSSRRR